MKKRRYLALLLVVTMLGISACGSKGKETQAPAEPAKTQEDAGADEKQEKEPAAQTGESVKLKMSWWGPETRHTTTIAANELYQQDHPNIEFEYEYADWNGYWDRMSAEAAGGNLPDIMCQDYSKWESWIKNDKLVDLAPYVESGALDISDCDEALLASGYVDGKLYGIPCGVNSYAMMYNKKVAEEAGISLEPGYTWEDIAQYSKAIYEKTGVKAQCQDSQEAPLLVEYHAREMGYSMVNEDCSAWGFPVEILEDVLRYNKELYDSGVCIDIDKARETSTYESNLITTGEQWYIPCWSNLFVSYTTVSDEELELTVMPDWGRDKGQVEYSTYIKPAHFWTVTTDCENPDEAVEMINFLVNDIDANLIIKGERGVPINNKVRAAVRESLDDPNAVKVFALLAALLLNAGTRFTGFYRALYYLPTLVGGSIAISVTWKLMFQTEGLINQLLQAVGIDSHVGWLTQTKTALGVLIALSIWQFGASMIFFNLIMTLINGFVNFTQAYVITAGKPVNSTMMYVMYLYNQAFRNGNMGYACGMSSFRESAEILRDSVRLFPKVWTLENYIDGWKGFGDGGYTFGTYFWNTFVICVVGTIGAVISSTMVGYGFARIHFPGKGIWFICMMLTMMLPGQVLSIPQYILFNKLGWVGSNLPLIVPAFFGQGFFIFLTMQFIQGIPYELDEAARIDGCSRYSTFVHIILPLIKPAVITTTIFSFYWKWDDYFCQRPYYYGYVSV